MNAKRNKEKGKDYVAHLTVRVRGGFVTVRVAGSKYLTAYVGVVGKVEEPPRFGPRSPAWRIVSHVLAVPGVVVAAGNTYPVRRILAENGYWFDKKSKVYRRTQPELQVSDVEEEPADFYEELGF